MQTELPAYLSVLDSSYDPVGVFDLNYNYTYFNQKMAEGVAEAYGVLLKPGMGLYDMLKSSPSDYEIAKTYWARTLAGETFSVTHAFGKYPNRNLFRITFGPIWDDTGKIIGGLHWSKNITAELKQKEENFRTTFDLAAIGLAHTNLQGEWVRVNKALCEITGHTPEELLEKNFLGITHPDDAPLSPDVIQKFFDGELTCYTTEKKYLHKLGHYVWVHVTVTMKRGMGLQPEYFIVSINDIDKLKKFEMALAESEQKFRQLANNLPQIIWTTTADGVNDYYNERWYEFTGDHSAGLDDEVWKRIIHPDDLGKSVTQWRECFESGTVYAVELRMWDRVTKNYRWFLSRAVPIKDASGKVIQWVGTSTDIHERKVTSEGLEKVIRMRDEFLSIVSHELKTPVTTLSMSAQMLDLFHGEKLSQLEDGKKIVAGIQQIEHQVHRLNYLINDMLDITRIRSGKLYLTLENLDLGEIIKEAVEKMSPDIKQLCHGKAPEMKLEEIEGLWDRARIEQVIRKLLDHATQFCDGKAIKIALNRSNETAVLSVKETGVSMPAEEVNKILDLFKRQDYAGQVSGIGLYIVKEIIRAHGGTLTVGSDPGTGTEYLIKLPIHTTRGPLV